MRIFDFGFSIFDWELPLQTRCRAVARNRKSKIQNRKFLPLLLLAALPLSAATSPADLIPADSPLVIIAHDIPALLDRLETSPWADTWNDDAVKKFLAPLREKIRCDDWPALARDRTGLSPDTLKTLIQGDVLFALPPGDTPESGPLIAADIGANSEKIHALIDALNPADDTPPDANSPPETYGGIPIHTITLRPQKNKTFNPIHWAIARNTLLASLSRDTLLRAIDASQRGAAPRPFSQSKAYLASTTAPGLTLYLNIQTAPLAVTSALQPFSPSTLSLLGLDALESFTISITFHPRATRIETALTYSEKRGILNLLTFEDTPLKLPSFASADWPAFTAANADLPALFDTLEDVASIYSPRLYAAYQDRLDEAASDFSINIKRDLIGSMGGRIVTATVLPPGIPPDAPNAPAQAGSLYVIELRDPRTFQNTLAGLIRATNLENTPGFSKRDYLGATIFEYKTSDDPLSIAVIRNQLILTSGATSITESLIQNIINDPPAPLSADPGVRAAFDAAPSAIRTFSAHDMRFTLRTLAALLSTLPPARDLVAPDAIPQPATFEKYWSHSYSWLTETSDTLRLTAEIPYKK